MIPYEAVFIGIDLGSTWVKAVALDYKGAVLDSHLVRTGLSFEAGAASAFEALKNSPHLADKVLRRVVSTGYGRRNVAFADLTRTEITCHARGAFEFFKKPCFVVDIGGQDNKVIELGEMGEVLHFTMNRKCAAGTGAFIEDMARRLDIDLAGLEALAESSSNDITLSSFCTVFSATEVLKLIQGGTAPGDLAKGILNSVTQRVIEMAPLGDDVVLTGGVAQAFPIIRDIFAQKTGKNVVIAPNSQFVGALGAGLLAISAED